MEGEDKLPEDQILLPELKSLTMDCATPTMLQYFLCKLVLNKFSEVTIWCHQQEQPPLQDLSNFIKSNRHNLETMFLGHLASVKNARGNIRTSDQEMSYLPNLKSLYFYRSAPSSIQQFGQLKYPNL